MSRWRTWLPWAIVAALVGVLVYLMRKCPCRRAGTLTDLSSADRPQRPGQTGQNDIGIFPGSSTGGGGVKMPAPRLVGKPTVYPGAGIMLAGAPSGVPQKPRTTVAGRGL